MPMGIGALGAPNIIIKRKFRWTFGMTTPVGVIPPSYVKASGRPQLEVDETELNFLNATTWIPGRAKWQPITVTYIDVANDVSVAGLYNWIATIYNFQDSVNLPQSEKLGWNGTGLLTMYDGCGTPLETWTLGSCWPQSVNFGELDMGDSDVATIEMTLRYSEVLYNSTCGPNPAPNCRGCGS